MRDIYRVTIHGRTLESRDLRQLLARAVSEKRGMEQRLRFLRLPLMASGFSPEALAHLSAGTASRIQ